MDSQKSYYIPHGSYWPFIGAVSLFVLLASFANALHGSSISNTLLFGGFAMFAFMLFGWFGEVIKESQQGIYNDQVDRSFRWGMGWFIFSEVMFFAAFFGALFYARIFSVPWLGGEGDLAAIATNSVLWPKFDAVWPLISPPDVANYVIPTALVETWHIPALNTIILLTSGVTITWAHHALRSDNRNQLIAGMMATVALGLLFLGFQVYEYGHAYNDLNLKLTSGIYGSTFYMLTGFHGFHVMMGTLMLSIILMRCIRGHFSKDNHFAFEGVAWYWHFVDVVWLGLFIFVYWI